MSDRSTFEALDDRLARLTIELADARRDLAQLRASMGARPPVDAALSAALSAASSAAPNAAPSARPAPPPPPPPAPPPPRPSIDLEKVVGRYGVLALAVLMIVMGAGALVSWALARGLIGPWVRISLGMLLAAALAAAGAVIRRKSNRWFGDALIALSLAVVHVVAWGMGPALHLVPSSVSLSVADVASVALMAFALRENIQALFSLGLGGALIAPFVTSTGEARYLVLAAYGVVVIATGLRLGAERAWRSVAILLAAGAVLYSIALGSVLGIATLAERDLVVGFAGSITLLAIAFERAPLRPLVAGVAVSCMALGLVVIDVPNSRSAVDLLGSTPDLILFAAVTATLSVYVARQLPRPANPLLWGWFVLALPLAALLATHVYGLAFTRDRPWRAAVDLTNAAIALVWAAGYWLMSRREVGENRASLMIAAGMVGASAVALATRNLDGVLVPALATYGALFGLLARREGQPRLMLVSALALVAGFAVGLEHLWARPSFSLAPFLTLASFECATVVAGAYGAVRLGARENVLLFGAIRSREQMARGAAFIVAFLWCRDELGRMISHDVATFAVIIYYATVGLLLIWRGRRIGVPILRHGGLGLAVWAALTALGRATDLDDIVWRVGSFLGVGAFLLGVAWWYRVESAPATAEQAV